jgi:hypothetical protein
MTIVFGCAGRRQAKAKATATAKSMTAEAITTAKI